MSDKTYRVVVTREGDSWLADVPEVEGTHTWAKNLPSLDANVREAIALAEDLPDGAEPAIALAYTFDVGDADLNAVTAHLRAERERIQREERQLAEQTAAAAVRLTGRDLSVRDAAMLLGVSPQRISQVAPQATKRARKTAAASAVTATKRQTGKKVPARKVTARSGVAVKANP